MIAEVFAEYGAEVAVCSRKLANYEETADALHAAYGVKTKAYACNVADEQEVERTASSVIAEFRKIDILVNNSGATWGKRWRKYLLRRGKR